MHRRAIRSLIPAFAFVVLTGLPLTATNAGADGVPGFGHVFVIIGENTELGQINASNAPYILGTLKPKSAWLTHYYAITHFSEANYVGMMSGQYTSCQQFDYSAASCHQDVDNLFRQLDSAGVSWQAWMESMPSPCYLTSTGGRQTLNHYGAKHNPPIFFDGIESSSGTWSDPATGECVTNDIPMGGTGPNDTSAFDSALASGDVARFNFIVPNECEDAHDNCKPAGPPVAQFDDFLAREVPNILNSDVFRDDPNSVLLVTFDEGTSNQGDGHGHQFAGGGNIMFTATGPLVQRGVYSGVADHYSLLQTLEDGFGADGHLGGAATANPLPDFWK
jgi:hypothetical protein